MKKSCYLLFVLVALLSLAACTGNKEPATGSGEESQMTEEQKKLNEKAKSLGYDEIEEREELDRVFRYGSKQIDDKRMLSEIKFVFEECSAEISDTLDDDYQVTSHGVRISVKSEDPKAFVSNCEVLFPIFFQKESFKEFDNLYVSMENSEIAQSIYASKDEKGKITTVCTDTTTEKSLETEYAASQYFGALDGLNQLNQDVSDLKDAYKKSTQGAGTSKDLSVTYSVFNTIMQSGIEYFDIESFSDFTYAEEDGLALYKASTPSGVSLALYVDPSSSMITKLFLTQLSPDETNVDIQNYANYLFCILTIFYNGMDSYDRATEAMQAIDLSSGAYDFAVRKVHFSMLYIGSAISCTVTPL